MSVAFNSKSDLSPRALLLGLLLALTLWYGNLAKESYMDDYRAFYVASLAVHDHLDPYVNHVNESEKYVDSNWLRADSRFIYPPTALFFAAPLRLLAYKWSKTAFGVAMTLTMVGILLGLHGRFPRRTPVLAALFLTLPMFMNIDNGNCDILILALLLGAFYLEDGVGAGGCLGAAIAIKFSPLLALLWFVANRRWRTAVWGLATSGVLATAAWLRWGGGYYLAFWTHLKRHGAPGSPTISHTFETLYKIQNEVIVTADGVFDYQHDVGGYMQNPLRLLGNTGAAIGLALILGFVVWLVATGRGRALKPERSFFLFLVFWLLANPLLWAMGLVACFPLIVLAVDEAPRANLAAALLLAPMFLTKQVVGQWNFALWLVCAGWCVWECGWLAQASDAPAAGQTGGLRAITLRG